MNGDCHCVGPQNFGGVVEPVGELYPSSLLLSLWRLGIRCSRRRCCCIWRCWPRLERWSRRRGYLHLHVASHQYRDLERSCGAKPQQRFRPDVDFLATSNRVGPGSEASASERTDPGPRAASGQGTYERTDAGAARCFPCCIRSPAIRLAGERFGNKRYILGAIWRR